MSLNDSHIDRRRILAALAAAPAVLAVTKAWAQNGVDAVLLEQVLGPLSVRAPERFGRLEGPARARLLALFDHIGRRWDMENTGVGEDAFAELVDLKALETPSYLTEYKEADALLVRVLGDTITNKIPQAEFDALLVPRKVEGFDTTRLGRFQKFVSSEFITWYVSRGGFKRFGFTNYRGWPGGPFTDPANPPYRTLKS